MSAKSVAGPGGKKPASAATNLIGKLRAEEREGVRVQQQNTDFLAQLVEVLV
jgi:hypothetical protein